MNLDAAKCRPIPPSNLQSLRKCPSHLGQHGHQLYLSIFCLPLLWYWERWSFNTLSPSQLCEHCNYSTHSFYQQTKPISLKKRAVSCSRARSLEYSFIKISGNWFFTGKETKRKQDQKKKTWCVKRKQNSSRDNSKTKYNRKTPQKYLLLQGWLWCSY